jgi:adenosylmethionine-8-amino-7-oxononanoate aminotransferase
VSIPFRRAADLQPFHGPLPLTAAEAAAIRSADPRVLWKPFTQMALYAEEAPPIMAEGCGSWLRDVDGRAWLDGVASLWVNVHGHGHPAILRRLRRQLDLLDHSTLLGPSNAVAVELATRLLELAPGGGRLARVFYSDSGSTAVEVALKMAFQYHRQHREPVKNQRNRFAALTSAYHGDTLGSVSVGGIDLFHGLYGPLLFPVDRLPAPDPYHRAFGDDPTRHEGECLEAARRHFALWGAQTAALIVEPLIQGAAGMIRHSPEWLQALTALAREHGVLVIVDEVATGFGRTGALFACELASITPDLLCLAKGITGGVLPLAATLASEEIHQGFLGTTEERRTFFHGHSYTGNPLACAAALGSLDAFVEDRTLRRLGERLPRLAAHLDELALHPMVGDVRRLGAMVGIELVRERATGSPWPAALRVGHRVVRAAMAEGVLLRPLGDVVVLMPPLCVSEEEIDLLAGAVGRAFERVSWQLTAEGSA